MITLQEKYDIRKYFEQYTLIKDKKVLDFGCANGNFVNFESHKDYTGIDVRSDVIDSNKETWPEYNWVHYNGYNYMYNPTGTEKLSLSSTYDICVSFSVITHMRVDDIVETVDTLKQHCDNLYISYYSNKDKFAYETICWYRKMEANQWQGISNNDFYYIETNERLWTFFDDDYIADKLGATSYQSKFPNDDLRGLQRCLVIES